MWANADVLRGTHMPNKYGDVVIPMTVLRRLGCTLEQAKDKVLPRTRPTPAERRKLCAAIDSVIGTRTKQLQRLDDRHKEHIFAYVTGKKEIPTHAKQQPACSLGAKQPTGALRQGESAHKQGEGIHRPNGKLRHSDYEL